MLTGLQYQSIMDV